MPVRLMLLTAIAFAAPLPALAQDPPAPAPAPAAPSDADVTAAGRAFRSQVETMNAEVRAAVEASGANRRRAAARVDEVLARHAPDIEAFAVLLERYFAARASAAETDEARASTLARGAASVAQVRGIPDQVRAGLDQQGQVRPDQPRNTQPSTGY